MPQARPAQIAIAGAPPALLDLPTELISKIIVETLDPDHRIGLDPFLTAPRNKALELLKITHISSHLRAVAIEDASLWTLVPHLNDINKNFFLVILARTKTLPYHLSMVEDQSLTDDVEVWDAVFSQFDRVGRFCALVPEEAHYEDSMLRNILSLSAPALTHCTIHFLGARNIALGSFHMGAQHPFDTDSANLHSLDLINCFFPEEHYNTFRSLSNVSVKYTGDSSATEDGTRWIHIRDIFTQPNQLERLCSLTLFQCVAPHDQGLDDDNAIYLPNLTNLTFSGSTKNCKQLARLIRIPLACFRNIIVDLPTQAESDYMSDAAEGADAAALFVPRDIAYTLFSICVDDGRFLSWHFYQDIRSGYRLVVSVHFSMLQCDLANFIAIHASNPNRRNLTRNRRNLTRTRPFTLADAFTHRILSRLVLARGKPLLSTVPNLMVSFDRYSNAPKLIAREVLQFMKKVVSISSSTSDVWANPFVPFYFSIVYAPKLDNISIPFDEDFAGSVVLTGISSFLSRRRMNRVAHIEFRVPPSTLQLMGHAADEEISCILGGISRAFRFLTTLPLNM